MNSGQNRMWRFAARFCFVALLSIIAIAIPVSSQEQTSNAPPAPGPMLAQGTIELHTTDFDLTLVRSSQTIAALRPKISPDFDFTPGDLLAARSQDGYFHLGDITLRTRMGDSTEWKNYSTASKRAPVTPLPTSQSILTVADLTPTLPEGVPLKATRIWHWKTATWYSGSF